MQNGNENIEFESDEYKTVSFSAPKMIASSNKIAENRFTLKKRYQHHLNRSIFTQGIDFKMKGQHDPLRHESVRRRRKRSVSERGRRRYRKQREPHAHSESAAPEPQRRRQMRLLRTRRSGGPYGFDARRQHGRRQTIVNLQQIHP
jgi:hypothetical protein